MLKSEIKQKWLEALRSGQYRQVKEGLRRKVGDCDGYCCLGVLCDVSSTGNWTALSNGKYYYEVAGCKEDDFPPISVVDLALDSDIDDVSQEAIRVSELADPEGFARAFQQREPKPHWRLKKVFEQRVFSCLAIMNDEGASFEEIADVIEQYL